MLAAVLTLLLAQAEPSPAVTLPGGATLIRRMPQRQPRIVRDDVVIRNSGSTNAAGYTIVVHSDYSADVADARGAAHRTHVAAPQAKWLFAKVRQAMPLDALPAAACIKSASFGSSLVITYGGATTPDLTCATTPGAHELVRTAGIIAAQLR